MDLKKKIILDTNKKSLHVKSLVKFLLNFGLVFLFLMFLSINIYDLNTSLLIISPEILEIMSVDNKLFMWGHSPDYFGVFNDIFRNPKLIEFYFIWFFFVIFCFFTLDKETSLEKTIIERISLIILILIFRNSNSTIFNLLLTSLTVFYVGFIICCFSFLLRFLVFKKKKINQVSSISINEYFIHFSLFISIGFFQLLFIVSILRYYLFLISILIGLLYLLSLYLFSHIE